MSQSDQIVSLGDAAGSGNTLSVNGNGNRAQYHLFFVCEVCGSSHSSKWERWLHINNTHNNESSIKVSFKTKENSDTFVVFHIIISNSILSYLVRMGELRKDIRDKIIAQ